MNTLSGLSAVFGFVLGLVVGLAIFVATYADAEERMWKSLNVAERAIAVAESYHADYESCAGFKTAPIVEVVKR